MPNSILNAEDSHHALRVLRLSWATGARWWWGRRLRGPVSAAADPVRVRLDRPAGGRGRGRGLPVQVGAGAGSHPPRGHGLVLEKGTEVGASFFVLVQAAGSAASAGATRTVTVWTRWRRIALEAAKQSKQIAVPSVESWPFGRGRLRQPAARPARCRWSSTRSRRGRVLLRSARIAGARGEATARRVRPLWVGPEERLDPRRVEQFSAAGAARPGWVRSVLRTETAGPVAVAVARLVLGDW